MERLIVREFLGIKEADLEVGKFTVIIGPQASGKSVLAKLVYFFRESLVLSLNEALRSSPDIERLKANWSERFHSYFPAYSWGQEFFEICYSREDFEVRIDRSVGHRQIGITFEDFDQLPSAIEASWEGKPRLLDSLPFEASDDALTRSALANISGEIDLAMPLFIPAGRSFLAILQRNAFTLFRSGLNLDPFMWDFGASLERLKSAQHRVLPGSDSGQVDTEIEALIDLILVGKYRHSEGEDWIEAGGRTVSLSHASSGQQEAFPMLYALSSQRNQRGASTIIEEPEAHLFPDSQRNVVRLLALLQRRYGTHFLVTTHSPYILTALNNLIIAGEVLERLGKIETATVVDPNFQLRFEDVRAYAIQDGRLVSILDDESRLIGVNVIDGVSEVLSEEFDALLDLKYSEVEG